MEKKDWLFFYKVIKELDRLAEYSGAVEIQYIREEAAYITAYLQMILELNADLKSIKPNCQDLLDLIEKHVFQNKIGGIPSREMQEIVTSALELKNSLMHEIPTLSLYLVTPLGGYDVNVFLSQPERVFPEGLFTLIPNIKEDVEDAMKCMAFKIPTSAAFHLHRINERVLHNYYEHEAKKNNKELKRKLRTQGAYIAEMEKQKFEDEKILSVWKQIKDFYRNPVLHPEQYVTLEQSIELLGLILSVTSKVIRQMSKDICEVT